MTMPNFLVIGAAKCGTDALCTYLGRHPCIYMSANREPMFFSAEGRKEIPFQGPGDRKTLKDWNSWINTLALYQALFSGVSRETAIGEGSTWYIYDEKACSRIYQHIPDAKLIAILRNPADRAYSAFNMLIRDGRESTADFAAALAAEDERVDALWEPIWHYRRMGFYYAQLKRYYHTFASEQIRVVLYDDFNTKPRDVMRDLFLFLGVDAQFEVNTLLRPNVSMVPKVAVVHRFVAGDHLLKAAVKTVLPAGFRQRVKARLMAPNLKKPAPMSPHLRRHLTDIFRPDILQLQDLIHRDLSRWLQ
jgi:hypothetical protein